MPQKAGTGMWMTPWMRVRSQQIGSIMDHINSVNRNIKFISEKMNGNKVPFLDCAVIVG